MGHIFWNFIARVAFIIGFVTAAARAEMPKPHEAPKGGKVSPSISSKGAQSFRYCMPQSMGTTCKSDTGITAIVDCGESLNRLHNKVVLDPQGMMSDDNGPVLDQQGAQVKCFVTTSNIEEGSFNAAMTAKRSKR